MSKAIMSEVQKLKIRLSDLEQTVAMLQVQVAEQRDPRKLRAGQEPKQQEHKRKAS